MTFLFKSCQWSLCRSNSLFKPTNFSWFPTAQLSSSHTSNTAHPSLYFCFLTITAHHARWRAQVRCKHGNIMKHSATRQTVLNGREWGELSIWQSRRIDAEWSRRNGKKGVVNCRRVAKTWGSKLLCYSKISYTTYVLKTSCLYSKSWPKPSQSRGRKALAK